MSSYLGQRDARDGNFHIWFNLQEVRQVIDLISIQEAIVILPTVSTLLRRENSKYNSMFKHRLQVCQAWVVFERCIWKIITLFWHILSTVFNWIIYIRALKNNCRVKTNTGRAENSLIPAKIIQSQIIIWLDICVASRQNQRYIAYNFFWVR